MATNGNLKARLYRIEKLIGDPGDPTQAEIQDASNATLEVIHAKLARACGQDVDIPTLTARQQQVSDWVGRKYGGASDGARARLAAMLERLYNKSV